MQVTIEYSSERLLELVVCERVTEGVERTVSVTEEVEKHVEVLICARAPAFCYRYNVIRRPTSYKTTEDDRDGPQSLVGSVLGLGAMAHLGVLLLFLLLETSERFGDPFL